MSRAPEPPAPKRPACGSAPAEMLHGRRLARPDSTPDPEERMSFDPLTQNEPAAVSSAITASRLKRQLVDQAIDAARQADWIAAAEVGAFVAFLGLGLVYAWRKGALEWR